MRFTLAIEDASPESLSNRSVEALGCLVQVWRMLESQLEVDQKAFLHWRCGQALNDCLLFGSQELGLPDKEDVFSTLSSAGNVGSFQLLPVLRRWWNGETVDPHDYSILATRFEDLIRFNDIRGVSELLHAIQLIPNHELTPLRSALRPHLWRLHRQMLPMAAWVLDDGLLNAIYLWVVQGERTGALTVPHKDTEPGAETYEGESIVETTCISRLQFGFGAMPGDGEASKRWIYSWSILYRCLQYVPSGLKDEIYPLLFIDSDLFSWSQLCRRLRYICRLRIPVDGRPQHDLLLDGIDEPHSDFAGLGHLSTAAKGPERITQLTRKIDGLHRLHEELQRTVAARDQKGSLSRGQGLDNLAGLCTIWTGLAHLARAAELSDLRKAPAMPPTMNAMPPTMNAMPPAMNAFASYTSRPLPNTQHAKAELEAARKEFQRAFERGRKLKVSWLVLQAGNGLLNVHDPLFDLAQRTEGTPRALVRAAARLTLCEALKDAMRFPLVQALGAPLYMFAIGSRIALTTAPQHELVQLYQAAQHSLHSLGRSKEATTWLQEEADHTSLGHAMSVMMPVDETDRVESGDAPIRMESYQEWQTRWLQEQLNLSAMIPAPEPVGSMDRAMPVIDRLLRTYPASWGPAKVIQFGWSEEDSVVIYATDMDGRVSEEECPLQRDELEAKRLTLSSVTSMTTATVAELRAVDDLAWSIADLTLPDELLVFVPGSVARGIPLHMLVAGRRTLSERNRITYAPSPDLMRRCIRRSLDVQRVGTRQRRTTSAAVFACEDPEWTTEIEGTGASVARRLRGRSLISNQVTKRAVSNALTRDQWFFFFGHGWGGRGSDGTLSLPAMMLQGEGESLRLSPGVFGLSKSRGTAPIRSEGTYSSGHYRLPHGLRVRQGSHDGRVGAGQPSPDHLAKRRGFGHWNDVPNLRQRHQDHRRRFGSWDSTSRWADKRRRTHQCRAAITTSGCGVAG